MSKPTLGVIATLLLAVCIGEGIYIARLQKVQSFDPWAPVNSWIANVQKEVNAGQPVPEQEFDNLFNDRFFKHRFDPFKEIEAFPAKVQPMIQADKQALLNQSWARWFNSRMDLTEIQPQVTSNAKQVILTMNIPHLKGDSLKVNVNRDRVRLSYVAETRQSTKDQDGRVTQTSSTERFEKVMPLPAGANGDAWSLVREPNKVKIVFDKTAPATGQWSPPSPEKTYSGTPVSSPAQAVQ